MKMRLDATGYNEWVLTDGGNEVKFEADLGTEVGRAKLFSQVTLFAGAGNGTVAFVLDAIEAVGNGAIGFGPPRDELRARALEVAYSVANPNRPQPKITCLADVQAKKVDWLWNNRIPKGAISLIVGRPGEGKSFMSTDFAARISTGSPWPDGSPCEQGSVLFLIAEDTAEHVVKPRLVAGGADCHNCHILEGAYIGTGAAGDEKKEMFLTLADVEVIRSALSFRPHTKCIIIDPIGSFLSAKTDAHRDNEVRGILTPITKLAEEFNLAVLMIAHRRKASGDYADDLVLGSRAFTGIARAVWHVGTDSENENRRLFLPGKNNLGPRQMGLAFSIGGEPARLWWEKDPVDLSADAGLTGDKSVDRHVRGRPAEARTAAETWLVNLLSEGPAGAGDVQKECVSAGFSFRTVQRAAESLGVQTQRARSGGGWVWTLSQSRD